MDGQTSGRRSIHLFLEPCRNISWHFGEAVREKTQGTRRMVQRSRGSSSALPRTRIGFQRGGGTHLGTSHVPGHARRATEERSRHGRCGDRGGERLRCRYGQRKALSRREFPQSAALGVISSLTLGPNGMKTAQRATLSYQKRWWPGTELNRDQGRLSARRYRECMRDIPLVTRTWGISIPVLGLNNAGCSSFEQRMSEATGKPIFVRPRDEISVIDARLDPCHR